MMKFRDIIIKGRKCREFLKQSKFNLVRRLSVKFVLFPVKVRQYTFTTNHHPFYVDKLPIKEIEQKPKWVWLDYVFVHDYGIYIDNSYISTDFIEYKDRKYKIKMLL